MTIHIDGLKVFKPAEDVETLIYKKDTPLKTFAPDAHGILVSLSLVDAAVIEGRVRVPLGPPRKSPNQPISAFIKFAPGSRGLPSGVEKDFLECLQIRPLRAFSKKPLCF